MIAHPHVTQMTNGTFVVERVPVHTIWKRHRQGIPVATLVKFYPRLGWAKVLDAIAFVYDNPELFTPSDNLELFK